MQLTVGASVVLPPAAMYAPFLQPIFDIAALGAREWALVLPLLLVPSVAAEITEAVVRRRTSVRVAEATA